MPEREPANVYSKSFATATHHRQWSWAIADHHINEHDVASAQLCALRPSVSGLEKKSAKVRASTRQKSVPYSLIEHARRVEIRDLVWKATPRVKRIPVVGEAGL